MNGATFGYDYLGNKLWELSAADAAKNLPFTAKYEYNESNQVIKTYNALGQQAVVGVIGIADGVTLLAGDCHLGAATHIVILITRTPLWRLGNRMI